MDISLINAGLAAGAALAAVPVILHLFMKQTPKHVIFPALRLIRERQKRSKKKLQVKNWLLLLARMALLALMALALARPTIVTEASIGDVEVPTAIGLVFDTSLSMSYKQPDKTRLALAKERALEVLKKTPSTSEVFVVDSSEPGVPPPLSPDAARKRIEALEIRPVNRRLNDAVGQAYAAVAAAEKPRHEVYVLTDLVRSSWDADRPVENLEKRKAVKTGVRTYVLRLTPRDVRDVSVVDARPVSEVVTEGEPLVIRAKLRSQGPASERVAKLVLDGKIRDQKVVKIEADGEQTVSFEPIKADATVPLHQGEVRLAGSPDPLEFDDVRYFSYAVTPAANVLIVADQPSYDADFLRNAIDPSPDALAPGAARPFRAEVVSTEKFSGEAANLGKRYRCVFLNNVESLGDADWKRLTQFVRDGGGLVVGLGNRCRPESYDSTLASQLLPASLEKRSELSVKEPATFGEAPDATHPLFSRFTRELLETLSQVPVYRYWKVKPNQGSRTLLTYTDKSPALVERVFNEPRPGRVLLWTTPLSRRSNIKSADAWNEFPLPQVGWSYWWLMRQTVAYTAETNEQGLNFEAGANVVLAVDPTRRYKKYIVQSPDQKDGAGDPQNAPEGGNSLVVVAPPRLGNWGVKASGSDGKADALGFSVNAPEDEARFVPLEAADLDKLFGGKKQYALADDPESLERVVDVGRVGRELFPWLMFLIMIVVTLESILANRFYREPGSTAAGAVAGAA